MDYREEVHELARKYLHKVRRTGPNDIMAVCPFHVKPDGSEEKTPSFAMSVVTGLYFCHSCLQKGNLFTFLRDIGLSRMVIERHYRVLLDGVSENIPLPFDSLRPKHTSFSPIDEALLGLFDYVPPELVDKGFTKETLKRFEIGIDNWHGRTTYPLRDFQGKLVGISGRNPDGVHPRYKVYTDEYKVWQLPERGEPEKRYLLWNIDKIYPEIFTKGGCTPLVLVEGFKACMWVHQTGLPVSALLGTYLSPEQQWILERLGVDVYLFLDNNFPGRRGAIKAADRLSRSLNVRMMNYPDRLAMDPDAQPDACTAEEILASFHTAPSHLQWLIRNAHDGK